MNETKEREVIEIDLLELAGYWLGHWISIVLVTLLALLIAFLVSRFAITPMYSSTSQIYIVGSTGNGISGILTDLQVGTSLRADYRTLAKSRTALEEVIEELSLDDTYGTLEGRITVENPTDTHILTLTAEDEDPMRAKEIADALAGVMVHQVADIMEGSEPNIFEYGIVPVNPSSPNILKNTLLGALIGLALILGLHTVRFVMDDTIMTPEDVEKYLGLNNLGSIPIAEEEKQKKRKKRHVRHA